MTTEWIEDGLTLFETRLRVLDGLLAKAEAQGQGRDLDALALVSIAPDMFSLGRQVSIASSQAMQFLAWLEGNGVPMPQPSKHDITWSEARAQLAAAIASVAAARGTGLGAPELVKHIAIAPRGICLDLPGTRYLNDWLVPNFYFHLTTAYALLRSQGVEIGKSDYLGFLAAEFKPIPQPA